MTTAHTIRLFDILKVFLFLKTDIREYVNAVPFFSLPSPLSLLSMTFS